MNDIFKRRNTDRLIREKYKLNLEIPKPNQFTFETRRLRSYGPKIWNALPYHIKASYNLNSFKTIILSFETIVFAESGNILVQEDKLSQKT